MTRLGWVVLVLMIAVLGGAAIVYGVVKKEGKTVPHQELARAVLVPTEKERLVLVPPCGTGVPTATIDPEKLAETPGTVRILLHKDRGDRILVIPRCRASQGAQPAEGAELPSSAFVLPIGANITAGRAGSAEAGTELVESQLVIPANSDIKTVVVGGCIERKKEAKVAVGRQIILEATRGEPDLALAPPC